MSLITEEKKFGSLSSYVYGTETYDSTKLGLGPLIKQFTGTTDENKYISPMPTTIGRPVETGGAIPAANVHAIPWSSNIDWIFFADQAVGAATRRVQLYTYDRTTALLAWSGFITVAFPYGGAVGAFVVRSIKCLYTKYTTGSASVSGVTMSGTGGSLWLDEGVCPGSRIGFGTTDPTTNPTWYEIAVPYTFTITSGSATAGDVYTNNGQFFTVINTITGHTCLVTSGTGAPTTAAGTLTRVSGTGDINLFFSTNWGLGFTTYTCSAANATVGDIYSNNVYTFTITTAAATVGDTYYNTSNYTFTITAGFAAAGTTYTNNTQTFTVNQTINGATVLTTSGTGAPLASGTLTRTGTGSGDATLTFSAVVAPTSVLYTVTATNVTGVILQASGTRQPLLSGTLTKASGSGAATITYSAYITPLFVVNDTIAGATTLVTTGTITPDASGTLTKIYGTGDATITYSASSFSTILNTKSYLTTSAGTVGSGTYVIEGLRIVQVCTNATTATNAGVFVSKGLRIENFGSGGTAITASAAATTTARLFSGVGVDRLPRTNYWLRDAVVNTNNTTIGSDVTPFVSWTDESLYVLDTIANPVLFKYNLRAPLTMSSILTVTVTSANATINAVYTIAGQNFTVAATIAASVTLTLIAANGHPPIGAGTLTKVSGTGDATIVFSAYTTTDRYTLSSLVWKTGAHGAVTGTPTQMNNFVVATTSHGTGSGISCGYFTTANRIYRTADISGNLSGSTTWAGDNFIEVPPGTSATFALTSSINSLAYSTMLDKFVITTGNRAYLTKYQSGADPVWERIFLGDNKQLNQVMASSDIPVFPDYGVGPNWWVETYNGIMYLVSSGVTALLNFIYVIPFAADWEYSSTTNNCAILPVMTTANAASYSCVYAVHNKLACGSTTSNKNLCVTSEPIRISYRTSGISDNSGSWTLLDNSGDLTGIVSTSIQFKIEWRVLGTTCISDKVMAIGLVYEDFSTDSHYQPSVGNTVLATERFAWRFATAFGTTVPRLKIVIYDIIANSVLLTDDTTSHAYGVFERSVNGGTNWSAWDNTDKGNETTYIRYTPTTLVGDVRVEATLTQY